MDSTRTHTALRRRNTKPARPDLGSCGSPAYMTLNDLTTRLPVFYHSSDEVPISDTLMREAFWDLLQSRPSTASPCPTVGGGVRRHGGPAGGVRCSDIVVGVLLVCATPLFLIWKHVFDRNRPRCRWI
ncbi:hypothetical protein QJS10_CPA02g01042 [Acorus calamus]|uniref:Uncharacterized protein n=1 Tax=Acorus calamus TaxID=4465 RepID=A0AAV9FDY2_ACOCL|nr:hypothetical protein QJS10_CPA02g01042 [Acorus calamus]